MIYAELIQAPEGPFIQNDLLFTYARQQNEAFIARYTLLVKNLAFNLPLSAIARQVIENTTI